MRGTGDAERRRRASGAGRAVIAAAALAIVAGAAPARGAAPSHDSSASSHDAAPPAPAPRARNTCPLPSDAYLRARLSGAIESRIEWRAGQMECEGMQRPDGRGFRVTFRGRIGNEPVTFVFGVPRLDEGASGRAVPVNVTLIREGRGVYGTRGDDKCTLDDVRQTALAPDAHGRRWRVEARGFCLEPARAVGDRANDAILASTFDFAGYLTWELDPGPTAPGTAAPPSPAPAR